MSVATIALGEKLVAELKLVDSTDTLARWMAHYVAELMLRAEHAALSDRDEARQACASAILDLWGHARAFPAKSSAFESIDRVIETIGSLHPDGGAYYRNDLWRALDARADEGDSEVEKLLTLALGIDGAARNLIHHVLAQASRAAGRDSAEWLELAQHLDEEDPLTGLRIRIVRMGKDEARLKEHRIEQLEKRIAQLEYFALATQTLKKSIMESLEAAKAASRVPDEERERSSE
ncbi:AVAST type 3 anti-phage proein Avs3b [Xanthomonas sp. 3307]|uniref:AVAST type 3 anti-phage proein Avs3b n=1 Tax=Xanthomonas sp. 3307 TaxID=3035316 RepID=UPI001622A966|nr:AVAST type 3 anti-phage proein Avs3b [Xanthomonas sp. 3307]